MRKTSLLIVSFCSLVLGIQAQESSSPRIDKAISVYVDVLRQLDVNYVDTLNYEKLTSTAINQMLRQVDPYTIYYPKNKDEDLRMMTTGKYGGIGSIVQQREEIDEKGKKRLYVQIAEPYEGMPAQKNHVMAGDRILEVDGKNVKGMNTTEVSNLLRGEPHSPITLKLQRLGEKRPLKISFQREEIKLPAVNYAGMLDNQIGYICFSEFTEHSASDFKTALRELEKQGAKSLIIDLRSNGGGIVDEAIEIVSCFVNSGTEVVTTRGKTTNSNRSYKTSSPPEYKDMPLVILVDGNTASAAEIVSGSLQDLGRAKLIGVRTFGKGLVQSVRSVAYDGHMKVTTSRYYLPSGRCIQAIDYVKKRGGDSNVKDTTGGILPDIILQDSSKVDICYTLYSKQLLFDYATLYRQKHETIASPESFTLTDQDIEDFCTFLDEQKFEYETETSKFFKDMMKMAEEEAIAPNTIQALKAIEPQLKPDFRMAIEQHKDELIRILGSEIIERYYYQKGRIRYLIRTDKGVLKAIEELN